jgi:hypothetical protein
MTLPYSARLRRCSSGRPGVTSATPWSLRRAGAFPAAAWCGSALCAPRFPRSQAAPRRARGRGCRAPIPPSGSADCGRSRSTDRGPRAAAQRPATLAAARPPVKPPAARALPVARPCPPDKRTRRPVSESGSVHGWPRGPAMSHVSRALVQRRRSPSSVTRNVLFAPPNERLRRHPQKSRCWCLTLSKRSCNRSCRRRFSTMPALPGSQPRPRLCAILGTCLHSHLSAAECGAPSCDVARWSPGWFGLLNLRTACW